jgi:hypothetical protein
MRIYCEFKMQQNLGHMGVSPTSRYQLGYFRYFGILNNTQLCPSTVNNSGM